MAKKTYYNPFEEEVIRAFPLDEPDLADPAPRKKAQAPKSAPKAKTRTAKGQPAGRTANTAPATPKSDLAPMVVQRTGMFLGVVFLLCAAYALCSVISALFSTAADQAVVRYNSVGQIVSTGTEVANVGGPAGASLGDWLLTGTLGLGSFVIIYYITMLGLKMLGFAKRSFWPLTLRCLALAVTVSIVAGLITYTSATAIRFGGHHGYYVNQFLIDYTSPVGAIAISVMLVALVCIIYLTQISDAIRRARAKVAARNALHRQKQEEERALRDQMAAEMNETHVAVGSKEEEEEEPQDEEDDLITVADEDELQTTEEEEDDEDPLGHFGMDDEPKPANEEPSGEFKIESGSIEQAEAIQTDTYDPTAELSRFKKPAIELLQDYNNGEVTIDNEEQEMNKERIIKALAQFNIKIASIKATVGPTITLFEVVPAEGQRIAAIKRVEEDLALALKAKGIRIIAPIPGKGTIGIEVPNADPQVVSMRRVISSKKFQNCTYELPMALGATISNDVYIADLTKMPHLLVAGATGQGKSVGLNAIITSLLYKKHPAELKFVLIDPKMVEFSLYRTLENHYLAKLPDEEDAVITDPQKVVATLNSLCVEMDLRYSLLSQAGCRGVKEYNQKFVKKTLNPEKGHRYMPYIVVVVDEFADLIMMAGKEVEAPICRLAQKARAVGIHVIIATQRPSTNVITGLIKANFPGRIAFRVAQMVDSKTILDRTGAHQLVGKGDMFISTNGNMERVQCAFVDTPEVESICESIAEQPGFGHAYLLPDFVPDAGADGGGAAFGGQAGSSYDRDPLFEEAARFLVTSGNTASTSSLQRRYSIGYNRAGKLMDQLEANGIVGPAIGSKPRQVLVDPMTLDSLLDNKFPG